MALYIPRLCNLCQAKCNLSILLCSVQYWAPLIPKTNLISNEEYHLLFMIILYYKTHAYILYNNKDYNNINNNSITYLNQISLCIVTMSLLCFFLLSSIYLLISILPDFSILSISLIIYYAALIFCFYTMI